MANPVGKFPNAVMTGLVPVIRPNASAFGDVGEPPDSIGIFRGLTPTHAGRPE